MTSEQQASTQTQGEAERRHRSLDELLSLDSYQGMSDEEIARVIAHKTMVAQAEAHAEALDSAVARMQESQVELLKRAQERSVSILEALASRVPEYGKVEDGS